MAHRTVDIKHPCGYHEAKHAVELGAHVRQDSDTSVSDHLRVRPCPKCKVRGGWTWTETEVHVMAAPKAKEDAKPKP